MGEKSYSSAENLKNMFQNMKKIFGWELAESLYRILDSSFVEDGNISVQKINTIGINIQKLIGENMEPFLDILHTHQTALIEKPYGSTQDFTYINQIYDLEKQKWFINNKITSVDTKFVYATIPVLRKYVSILGNKITIKDVIWEGRNWYIVVDITDPTKVIKIPKEINKQSAQDFKKEYDRHRMFTDILEVWKKELKFYIDKVPSWNNKTPHKMIEKPCISRVIRMPHIYKYVDIWNIHIPKPYMIMERIEGNNVGNLLTIYKISKDELHKRGFFFDDEHIGNISDRDLDFFLESILWKKEKDISNEQLSYLWIEQHNKWGGTLSLKKLLDEYWKYYRDLIRALHYLLRKWVKHTDLHNENIMIELKNDNFYIYLIDFALLPSNK